MYAERSEALVLPEACYSRGHISFWAGRKTSGLESKPTNDILKYKSMSRTDLQMLQRANLITDVFTIIILLFQFK